MNGNDLLSLGFIVLFGVVCVWAGRLWARRGDYEEGYRKGASDAARSMFKTAVRAASKTANGASRRWPPSPFRVRARVKAPSSIHDDTTVRISRQRPPNPGDEDTVVVVPFRSHRGEVA